MSASAEGSASTATRAGEPAPVDRRESLCIIGAGAAGLCAARALREAGLPYDQFERHHDVGGMWDISNPSSAVYGSTHMISSRRSSQLLDFKMPEDAADYPHHTVVARYFRDYARHFGLCSSIRFNAEVQRVEPHEGGWLVSLSEGDRALYRGVIVANGHQNVPLHPSYPGTFNGETLHSFDYVAPDLFDGRRVLIVGGGNSGADIAVDAAHRTPHVAFSLRRGYHVVPKFAWFGLPLGELQSGKRLPKRLERRLVRILLRLLVGRPRRYGLPEPDHEPLERHAIVGSQLLYHLAHGDLKVKPDVAELCGDRVRFVDGTEEEFDVIVWATGYRTCFPFLDASVIDEARASSQLSLQIFHPSYPELFFVGLVESVDGGNWRLFAAQSALIARYLHARDLQSDRAAAFESVRTNPAAWLTDCAKPHYVRNADYLAALDRFSKLLPEARGAAVARPVSQPAGAS